MAAPMEQCDSIMPSKMCEIEATVVTGFEPMAQEEVKELFDIDASTERGKINFVIPVNEAKKALTLQSIDNIYVIIKHIEDFHFKGDIKTDLEKFADIVPTLDWELGLSVWRQFIPCEHTIDHKPIPGWEQRFKETDVKVQKRLAVNSSTPEDNDDKKNIVQVDQNESGSNNSSNNTIEPPSKIAKKEAVPNIPSFRATCYRTGTRHSFQSPQAAIQFGGAIQDYFLWNVNLKNFDIEVVLSIQSNKGYAALALTKQSQHRRNISHFGPTTLRSTIAYNMLRLCKIQPAEVVCDPMCGGGSIPIEASINWPKSKHICGDMHELAVPRCQANIDCVNEKRLGKGISPIKVDVCTWDTTQLPLKDGSVDVFVTDMPFGKRSGSLMRNWQLYPKTLAEMARCARPSTGRACLLTKDKKCFTKTLGMVKSYWSVATVVGINIGGLAACVWCLNRTSKSYKGLPSREAQQKESSANME